MSLTVGYGPQYGIDLDQPLSAEELSYLQARDPQYRAVLEELGHREPLPDDGSVGASEGYQQAVFAQQVPVAPPLSNMTTR